MGLTRKMGKPGSAAGARVLTPGSMEATEAWLGTGKTEKQNFQRDRPFHSNNFGLSLLFLKLHSMLRQGVGWKNAFKGV